MGRKEGRKTGDEDDGEEKRGEKERRRESQSPKEAKKARNALREVWNFVASLEVLGISALAERPSIIRKILVCARTHARTAAWTRAWATAPCSIASFLR